jgi:putative transposase
MTKRDPFILGKWYHCYNRGIEKRIVFEDSQDYKRFLEILYLANSEFPLRRNDIGICKFEEVLNIPRGKKLVLIGAFCLMPDHFDLVVHEILEGGITAFMRKVGTAYTLYFNARNKRAGNLFLKPFQSRQVSTDRFLEHLINYVHCKPAVLYEPEWKTNHVVDPQFLEEQLVTYPYSSLGAYTSDQTPTRAIVDAQILSGARTASLQKMLQGARQYRADSHILE